MANGLIHATMPTVQVDDTSLTGSTYVADKTYTVSGNGVVLVSAGALSDDSNDFGTWQALIYYDGALIMGEGTRWGSNLNYSLGASTTAPIAVTDGKEIRIRVYNSKSGTKTVFRRFLCFGCTVS